MRATRTPAPGSPRAHVLALAPLAALATAAAMSAQGRVVLHQCLQADGPLALLGVRLAVLQDGSDCPDGAWALGDVPRGAVLLLGVVVPVLVAHVLLAGAGVGLGALAHQAVVGARALLRAGLPARVEAPAAVVAARPLPPVAVVRVRTDRGILHVRPFRGPPAVV